jgi:hypothetical protein
MVNGSSKFNTQIQNCQTVLLKENHSFSGEVAYTNVIVLAHGASDPVLEADLLRQSPK